MFLCSQYTIHRTATPVQKLALMLVLVCSLVELPFELAACSGKAEVVAVVVSKLLLSILIVCACGPSSLARCIALFVCGVSVLAILPALPDVYRYDPMVFLFSAVECSAKALAMIALLRSSAPCPLVRQR